MCVCLGGGGGAGGEGGGVEWTSCHYKAVLTGTRTTPPANDSARAIRPSKSSRQKYWVGHFGQIIMMASSNGQFYDLWFVSNVQN